MPKLEAKLLLFESDAISKLWLFFDVDDIVADITVLLKIGTSPGWPIMIKIMYLLLAGLILLFGLTEKAPLQKLVIIYVKKRFNSELHSAVRTHCHLCWMLLGMSHTYSDGISSSREWRQRKEEVVREKFAVVWVWTNIVVNKLIFLIPCHLSNNNIDMRVDDVPLIFYMLKLAWLRKRYADRLLFLTFCFQTVVLRLLVVILLIAIVIMRVIVNKAKRYGHIFHTKVLPKHVENTILLSSIILNIERLFLFCGQGIPECIMFKFFGILCITPRIPQLDYLLALNLKDAQLS